MIFRLLKPKAATPERAPSLPEGLRAYVIGDVHGRADLLESLARQIEADVAAWSGQSVTIFLGDYVDRGLHSASVIDRLARGDFPTPLLCLRGNHEETFLSAFADERVFESWRKFGGLETLTSYGIDVSAVMRGQGYEEARKDLVASVPELHRAFLSGLRSSFAIQDYFFSHAGIRPGVPLASQLDQDLLWIRHEFLNSPLRHEKIVVHGHTPVDAPEVRPNRINVDTGAYATGKLTCLVLEGTARRFLST